jgi:hypothetical protein
MSPQNGDVNHYRIFSYTTQVVLSARVMYVQSPCHRLLTKLTVAHLAKKNLLFFWNQNTY